MGYPNDSGECVFVVVPGDVDMDGTATEKDIDIIVNYWGQNTTKRNTIRGLDGSRLLSEYEFKPQYIIFNNVQDSCKTRADANGDGRIGLNDVLAVVMNFSESQHEYKNISDECYASIAGRDLDTDIFYEIYQNLPLSELKIAIAEKYGFDILPTKFISSSNYPNPFNPITEIRLDIPYPGNVMINIVNLKGQLIEEVSLFLEAGYHTYKWDASKFPGGIYFCQTFFDQKFESNHKMIYLK
jgi:hypothetical protein